jgi:hypothetical protein
LLCHIDDGTDDPTNVHDCVEEIDTFRRRVFTMNSRANEAIGAISNGFNTIALSNGSPGTVSQ